MDATSRLCMGCGRTLDEIARWGTMTPDERERIMAALPERLVKLPSRGTAAPAIR